MTDNTNQPPQRGGAHNVAGEDGDEDDHIRFGAGNIIQSQHGRTYTVVSILRQGHLGLLLCVRDTNQRMYAMKVIGPSPEQRTEATSELRVLDYLSNLTTEDERGKMVQIVESFYFMNRLCIVMELLGFSLLDVLQQRRFVGLPLVLIQSLLHDTLQALAALKRCFLVHGDISPMNILLRDNTSAAVKLIGFGLARLANADVRPLIQSPYYRAPEVFLDLPYAYPADMWSLGCVVFEMFIGLPLLPGRNDFQMLQLMVNMFGAFPAHMVAASPRRHVLFDEEGRFRGYVEISEASGVEPGELLRYFLYDTIEDLILHYGVTQEERDRERERRALLVDLLNRMLTLDPEARITPEAALEHEFLQARL